MVGDLHPLVAEPAGRKVHTTRQWDLDPLVERFLEPWQNDGHVEVVRVELDVEPPRYQGPGYVPQLRLVPGGGRVA
jgi:hypothetical protein